MAMAAWLVACAATRAVAGTSGLGAVRPDARPVLEWPVACEVGVDCWVAQYPDLHMGKGVRDPMCGRQTYEQHDGTDIALRDAAAMARGVAVRAAAAGVVRAVRDGEADGLHQQRGRDGIAGRECGNGVLVDHGGGWNTQYCHLKRGSVAVASGQRIDTGTQLGEVGLSGLTGFVHLHVTLRHGRDWIDPFTGRRPVADDAAVSSACGDNAASLWSPALRARLRYGPVVYHAGLADKPVRADHVREGILPPPVIGAERATAALWADAFGLEVGDEIDIQLVNADGGEVAHLRRRVDRHYARLLSQWRLNRPAAGWSQPVTIRWTVRRAAAGVPGAGTQSGEIRWPDGR